MIKNIKWLIFLVLITIMFCMIPISTSKYTSTFNTNVVLNVSKPVYTIHFYPNITGNETEYETQSFTYDTADNLRINTFTRSSYNFKEWTTNPDGTGTKYADGQLVNNLSQVNGEIINLYAQWTQGIAEVNGVVYQTLQDAVNAVTTSAQTTVKLLANTTEQITINSNQNIIFNLQNFTIRNADSEKSVIENSGTIRISNGKLWSNGVPAVINNNSGGTLIITGGEIEATGTNKGQAIYNNGGTVEISGTAYLTSKSNNRAVVHNLTNSSTKVAGVVTITGGTIISKGSFHAINNDKGGIVTIGINDGIVDKTTPVIQSEASGLFRTSPGQFHFYDGIIKGTTKAIDDETAVTDWEAGYEIAHGEEIIGSQTYKTAYLAITCTVTFIPTNGGTVDEPTRKVEVGSTIGELPVPINAGYIFDGWFTEETGGVQISSSRVITADERFYGHWTKAPVASINGTIYDTLQDAINAVPNNTQTTVTLLRDVSENVTVGSGKKILFDFSTYTLSGSASNAVIINNGTITINNGTIRQSAAYAAINNNNSGNINISGGSIISTGGRGAIYTSGSGTIKISGTAYLISNATNTVDVQGVTYYRGTIMSVNTNSKIIITGGTIISTTGIGVSDVGTLTIGSKDGQINSSSPSIKGDTYGVKATGTINLYDGVLKGITDSISGTISDQETNSQIVNGTETSDGKTYKTSHLEITP